MMSAEVEQVPERQQVQALLEEPGQEHEECTALVQEQPMPAVVAHQEEPASSTPEEVQEREEHQVRQRLAQVRCQLGFPPYSRHTSAAAHQQLQRRQALRSHQVQEVRVQVQQRYLVQQQVQVQLQ